MELLDKTTASMNFPANPVDTDFNTGNDVDLFETQDRPAVPSQESIFRPVFLFLPLSAMCFAIIALNGDAPAPAKYREIETESSPVTDNNVLRNRLDARPFESPLHHLFGRSHGIELEDVPRRVKARKRRKSERNAAGRRVPYRSCELPGYSDPDAKVGKPGADVMRLVGQKVAALDDAATYSAGVV